MEDASIVSPAPARPKTPVVLAIAQWVVTAFLAWLAIRSIGETKDQTVLLSIAIGCVTAVAILQSPPVFFRASVNWRYGIYAVTVASLLFLGLNAKEPLPSSGADAWQPSWLPGAEPTIKLPSCNSIVGDAIALSKDGGPEIFEINDIRMTGRVSNYIITCTGRAVTNRGDQQVEFGTTVTPQGNTMINLKYL